MVVRAASGDLSGISHMAAIWGWCAGGCCLIAGVASLIQRGRLGYCAAAALAAIGCVLYNADLAAPGLVLALVAAARTRIT